MALITSQNMKGGEFSQDLIPGKRTRSLNVQHYPLCCAGLHSGISRPFLPLSHCSLHLDHPPETWGTPAHPSLVSSRGPAAVSVGVSSPLVWVVLSHPPFISSVTCTSKRSCHVGLCVCFLFIPHLPVRTQGPWDKVCVTTVSPGSGAWCAVGAQ